MGGTLNPATLPKVWCDFNACGWSGEPGHDCFYAYDREGLASHTPTEGLRVFAYDHSDDNGEILGCEAVLERYGDAWRIRRVSEWRNG